MPLCSLQCLGKLSQFLWAGVVAKGMYIHNLTVTSSIIIPRLINAYVDIICGYDQVMDVNCISMF
jgi:hypothetical protein